MGGRDIRYAGTAHMVSREGRRGWRAGYRRRREDSTWATRHEWLDLWSSRPQCRAAIGPHAKKLGATQLLNVVHGFATCWACSFQATCPTGRPHRARANCIRFRPTSRRSCHNFASFSPGVATTSPRFCPELPQLRGGCARGCHTAGDGASTDTALVRMRRLLAHAWDEAQAAGLGLLGIGAKATRRGGGGALADAADAGEDDVCARPSRHYSRNLGVWLTIVGRSRLPRAPAPASLSRRVGGGCDRYVHAHAHVQSACACAFTCAKCVFTCM